MSTLRASVCKKLGLSATATQAEVYRAALKKFGLSNGPRKVTREAAHDWLVSNGFRPVPGSSRYQDSRGRTGRIVDDGGRGDTWNVEIED